MHDPPPPFAIDMIGDVLYELLLQKQQEAMRQFIRDERDERHRIVEQQTEQWIECYRRHRYCLLGRILSLERTMYETVATPTVGKSASGAVCVPELQAKKIMRLKFNIRWYRNDNSPVGVSSLTEEEQVPGTTCNARINTGDK